MLRSSSLRPLTARSVRAARNLFHGTPHHHAALPTPLRAPRGPPAARLLCTRPGMLATLHAPLHRSARRPPHAPPPTHPDLIFIPSTIAWPFLLSLHPPPPPLRLLIKCSSSHVVLMKHQLALTASLREQKRARREGGVGGTSAREVWRVDVVGLEWWQLSEVHVLRLRDCTEFGPALRHAELVPHGRSRAPASEPSANRSMAI